MRGIDYAWTHVPPAAIKLAGFGFVVRYLSRDPSKNLTKAEAGALLGEGIAVCANWEFAAQAMLGGKQQGITDAVEAETQVRNCGLAGIPVYFSADWDATPAEQTAIDAYLDGCASVLGHNRVGMYGGYWPLSRARAAGKASWWWGTRAWSGDNWDPKANPHTFTPHIMQGPGITVGGVQVDLDTANVADFGQWPRPKPPPPVPPATLVPTQEQIAAAYEPGRAADQVGKVMVGGVWYKLELVRQP